MKDIKDKELSDIIEKAKNCDEQALTKLYKLYYPKLVKYMYYRVPLGDAEDLASNVFVKVLKALGRQSGNFEAWLYRIAKNVIVDSFRYKAGHPVTELEKEDAEKIIETGDVHQKINNSIDIQYALSKLNDEQREFLILKFIQGLDNKAIAKITGKSIGALRALQFRALKAITLDDIEK